VVANGGEAVADVGHAAAAAQMMRGHLASRVEQDDSWVGEGLLHQLLQVVAHSLCHPSLQFQKSQMNFSQGAPTNGAQVCSSLYVSPTH